MNLIAAQCQYVQTVVMRHCHCSDLDESHSYWTSFSVELLNRNSCKSDMLQRWYYVTYGRAGR
jgi:hypothetical protein